MEDRIPEVTMSLGRVENIIDKRNEIEGIGNKTQGLVIREFSSGSFVTSKVFIPKGGSIMAEMEASLNKIDRDCLIENMKKML